MDGIIHCRTKKEFQITEHENESLEIVNKFIEAFILLDVSVFEPYMAENDVFEDMDKYRFLADIHSRFERIKSKIDGDFWVENSTTTCPACSYGKRVEHFKIYNKTTQKLQEGAGYLIDVRDGILFDIYRCNFFI